MPIPNDVIFACLALDGPFLVHGAGDVIVSNPVSVHRAVPVQLDNTWLDWLGSVLVGQLQQCQFAVLSTQPYTARNQGRAEEERRDILYKFHYGLLLQGMAYSHGGLVITGATPNGQLAVESVSIPPPHPFLDYRRAGQISRAIIDRASALVPIIRGMYGRPHRYIRLRRGLVAWLQGIHSLSADDRLHNFIRAIEAITKPDRYRITRTFVDRAQLFIGPGARKESLLFQLYNLRSCIEHVKTWRKELRVPRPLLRNQAFGLRAFQAEVIASSIYIRIFERPDLMLALATEAQFNRFWKRPSSERELLWGPPIDLRREQAQCFIP